FFEVMGAAGLEELARVFAACRKEGVPVLLDAKRGDIGSTAQLYAEAYLADTDLGADALTVNASLGLDTLEPLLAMARAHDRGLFVLLRTSNPGAPTFQDGMEPMLLPFLREEKSAGAVVGATDPKAGARLRKALPDTLFLVPGFGAQGGTELTPFFDEQGRGALVNSSRGILYAGEGRDDWQDAVADAASKAKQTIERARTR
ncbi:MAG: orotidine-5'-phosphate decarboxylase, partial [Planctomycetota bacterium]